jgi:lipopolysaccharide transport system ATP-binding protein
LNSDLAIKVSNLSKIYLLGKQKEDSIASSLSGVFSAKKNTFEVFSALTNINFNLDHGEVLGIIGRNGAGKSTLLKILSQITKPSEGKIEINGRIASLLEVGTGFHPELTGRENIYLNGTILGMTRKEVKAKFDEIVTFSGVEKFIDTPVKHYSSGMYVRLAFAVAAHLDPEILIIDEVLAVGDADFQKKCLGKMKEVAGHGRTVIFVSHNMEAVKSLCSRALFLEKGEIIKDATPKEVIDFYMQRQSGSLLSQHYEYNDAPGNEFVKLKSVSLTPIREDSKQLITVKSALQLKFEYWNEQNNIATNLSLHLFAATGECVFNIITQIPVPTLDKGLKSAECLIPDNLLNTGMFSISIMVVKDTSIQLFNFEDIITFEVEEERENTSWHGRFPGFVRPQIDFKLNV